MSDSVDVCEECGQEVQLDAHGFDGHCCGCCPCWTRYGFYEDGSECEEEMA